MMPFIYFTPIDWAVTIFAVVMLTLLIILWFLSVWKRKKHVYDAFGYVWRINSLANIRTKLNRLFLLPTISVVRNESLYAGHNIRYWSFDFMWLRKIYVLEVEQLNKKNMSKELSLNEYQRRAMETCLPTANNFSYMVLNLVGEVGEFASKVAKAIRKDQLGIHKEDLHVKKKGKDLFVDMDAELMAEAGDILWQLSGLCSVMGWPLEDIAQANLDKLASRKQRNVIDGNGDNR